MDTISGPDLQEGVRVDDVADGGMLAGRVGDEAVLLARKGEDFFALDAFCTHYHGPLAEGLIVGDTLRCPWHHACFELRTGSALGAPAMRPLKVYPDAGRISAVATLFSDDVSLAVEAAMARNESDDAILAIVRRAFMECGDG